MDRAVREAKKECVVFDEAIKASDSAELSEQLSRDFQQASIKLKRRETQLSEFIDKTGRTRLRERESPGGWGVSQAAKARGSAQSQHTQWLKSIGAQTTELNTVAKYYNGKYNNTEEYRLLMRYSRNVQTGWVSPLAGFDNYKNAIRRIDSELVGRTAANGVVITGQSDHFIQRVIGTSEDPKKHRPRSGVEIDDIIDAVMNGTVGPVEIKGGEKSQLLYNGVCGVSMNPDKGTLTQCNPLRKGKKNV